MKEEKEEFFVFEARSEVFDSRVVEKKLAVMVDKVKVFATFLVSLALDVGERAAGGGGGVVEEEGVANVVVRVKALDVGERRA